MATLPDPTFVELRRGVGALVSLLNRDGTSSNYLRVPAYRCGDWAVHRHVDEPSHWILTLLPLGANLPPDFATFLAPEQAYAAAVEIQRLRNDWHVITQADFTPQLTAAFKEICKRHGAICGLIGIKQLADHSIFGVRKTQRPNGYGKALG